MAWLLCGFLLVLPLPASPQGEKAADETEAGSAGRAVFEQYVPGLLVRTAYRPEPGEELSVLIWDLLVGPHRESEPVVFPGAAVLMVRSGSGLVSIDGERQETRIGASLSVPEGSEVSFDNGRGETALALRAIVISQK